MALITFNPLQQTIELLLSNGWEQQKGPEDDKFLKGERAILIEADHTTKDTTVELTLYHNDSVLLACNHTTVNPLVKYFIES